MIQGCIAFVLFPRGCLQSVRLDKRITKFGLYEFGVFVFFSLFFYVECHLVNSDLVGFFFIDMFIFIVDFHF